jgi:hypothetical protein
MDEFRFKLGDKFKILVGDDLVVAEIIGAEKAFKRYKVYELKADSDGRPVYRIFNEHQVAKFDRA